MLKPLRYGWHLLVVATLLLFVAVPWAEFIDGKVSLMAILQGPSWAHPLGTDNLGRDLLLRFSDSFAQAILPLWGITVLATLVGVALTVVMQAFQSHPGARAFGSVVTTAAAGVMSVPLGIGVFLLAVALDSMGLWPLTIGLGTVFLARVILSLWNMYWRDSKLEYWSAHRAMGGTPWQRVVQYGVAGIWRGELFRDLAFHLQVAVSIEASLSYLGFGIQEPQASIGNILASHFDRFLKGEFWVLGCCIAILLLASAFPYSLLFFLNRMRLLLPSRWRQFPLHHGPKTESLESSQAVKTL